MLLGGMLLDDMLLDGWQVLLLRARMGDVMDIIIDNTQKRLYLRANKEYE